MRDRFAIIGYGSLIWDLEVLAPHVVLPWLMGGGPALPMEFSRISAKRKMGLVVVLDAQHGEPCATHAVPSVRSDIHDVAEDLRVREQATDIRYIGAVCRATGFERSHDPAVADIVRRWCEDIGATGAVWTDLPRNFADESGTPFSLVAGREYLKTLRGESLAEAIRYIDNAPEQTNTPLRRALACDDWWQALPRAD